MTGPVLFVAIALAGGTGAALRFLVDGAIRRRWHGVLPLATLLINVSGSFVLGLLTGLVQSAGLPREWLLVLGGGLMGGYTTFGTAMIETARLHEARDHRRALVNLLGAATVAVVAAAAGWGIGSGLG